VPKRQPRPGDSVIGRRVSFKCDVLTTVLHESNPGFPLILPRYLMAVNFTAFDLAAYIIITFNGWLSICILISIVNTFKHYSQWLHVLCMVR